MTSTATPADPLPHPAPGGEGPQGAQRSLRSFRRYTYWSLTATGIGVLVLFMLTGPVPWPPDPVGVAAWAGLAVVAAAVLRLAAWRIPPEPQSTPPSRRAVRAWAVAGLLGSVPVGAGFLAGGEPFLWAFSPAFIVSLVIADVRPRRRWAAAAGAAVLAAALAGLAIGGLPDQVPGVAAWFGVLVTAFVLFLTLASVWTWDVAVQLDRARRNAAALAVANERLRFAADLHDIQGHHLQVIALKSELATRLARRDAERAAAEMAAVQQLAADALRDTRAVVQGYRRTTLDTEISNATAVLGSAGIDTQLRVDARLAEDGLPEAHRHLLGLVLREAVTNVIRHSDARHAEVGLHRAGEIQLTVVNDGVAEEHPDGHSGGLPGLATRLQQAGGVLAWGREGDRFAVRARLPLPGAAGAGPSAEAPEGNAP